MINDAGLLHFIRALRYHQTEFIELFVAGLVQYGTDNYIELLLEHLRLNSDSFLEYLRIL